jgi:hypothetical protein
MRTLKTAVIAILIFGIGTSAFAGDLQDSIAKAAQQQQQEERAPTRSTNKPLVWTGAALFVGGMAVGLFSFINNQNGSFSEFGEANAVNKPLGAAGLSAAFVGGTMMFLGSRRAKTKAPSVTIGARQLKVVKQMSW